MIETPATRYALAFAKDWRWYDSTEEVSVSAQDRAMLAAALVDLLAEQEFLDAVAAVKALADG